ncbi:MAG: ornithine cyclodeaminase family protein [Blastocatellia bacterium]
MAECIEVMSDALAALARGEVHQPLRTAAVAPGANGILGLMPAYRAGDNPAYGLKAVCVFPENAAKGLDSHQGGVLLFSGDTGQLLAVMDASAITAIRTAAVSAVATRLLARDDAATLAIIGAGVEARTHLAAIACVKRLKAVRVASRTPDSVKRFVSELQPNFDFGIEIADGIESALKGADIVVTATTSREPVVKREWVEAGAHMNVVGSSIRSTREVDTATMKDASLFVDRRESTLNEAGDYLFAAREGAIDPGHIKAELGEILTGQKPGRTSSDEITLFKSLGLGIEDLASAQHIYRKAVDANVGNWVEF